MRIRSLTASLLAAPLLLSTIAFEAPDGCYVVDEGNTAVEGDEVVACQQDVWLHGSTTKVSNLSDVGAQPVVTWDENAPTASVTSGAGAGALGSGVPRAAGQTTASSLHFAGEFTGTLDSIDLDLHAIAPTGAAYTLDDLSVTLVIDGVKVHDGGTQLMVSPSRPAPNASSPATVQFDFAFTNIDEYLELVDAANGPDAVHTVEVTVQPWFVNSGNWAWVFDTTEVPSGMRFNPVAPDAAASQHPVI